jgi:hypothetical protein
MGPRGGVLARSLAALLFSAAPGVAMSQAATECEGFRWDMTRELDLFQSTGRSLTAATGSAHAPSVDPQRLYEITLADQPAVRFVAPPAAHREVHAPSAGLLRLIVPAPGHYRISASGPVWIDVFDGDAVVAATDFNGHSRCTLIHKSVDYAFASAGTFLVQLSQSPSSRVRLGVTPAPVAH